MASKKSKSRVSKSAGHKVLVPRWAIVVSIITIAVLGIVLVYQSFAQFTTGGTQAQEDAARNFCGGNGSTVTGANYYICRLQLQRVLFQLGAKAHR